MRKKDFILNDIYIKTNNDIVARNGMYMVLAMQGIIVKIILYHGIYIAAVSIFSIALVWLDRIEVGAGGTGQGIRIVGLSRWW